jgi:flagellar basal body-associated protein FliL
MMHTMITRTVGSMVAVLALAMGAPGFAHAPAPARQRTVALAKPVAVTFADGRFAQVTVALVVPDRGHRWSAPQALDERRVRGTVRRTLHALSAAVLLDRATRASVKALLARRIASATGQQVDEVLLTDFAVV